jgi:hypothetical protein
MEIAELVEALVGICEIEDSTTYVDELLASARAALAAGNGTVGALTTGAANGKSFGKTIDLNPAEVVQACIRARRLYEDDDSPQVVLPDFSRSLPGC